MAATVAAGTTTAQSGWRDTRAGQQHGREDLRPRSLGASGTHTRSHTMLPATPVFCCCYSYNFQPLTNFPSSSNPSALESPASRPQRQTPPAPSIVTRRSRSSARSSPPRVEMAEIRRKLVIVGDGACGKTCLLM